MTVIKMLQYADLSIPDPEFAALAAQIKPCPPDPEDVTLLRENFNSKATPLAQNFHRTQLPAESAYQVEDHNVPVEGAEIKVRCLTPTPTGGEDKVFPLLVWFHGGCWTVGTTDLDDYYLRIICVNLQISVVNVEYRLAPEHPFPTGVNDSYIALKWAAENAALLNASPPRGLIVGGTSAGGNLAASCALRARDDPYFEGRKVTGQLLQIPITLHPDGYPEKYKSELLSMEQFKDTTPFLNGTQIHKFYRLLAGDAHSPLLSPALATTHQGVAPAYVQVFGLDPLRDEGLLYARLLKEAGVPTKLDVYPGVPHGFQLAFSSIQAAAKLDREFKAGLKWLLAGAPSKNV